VRRHQRPILGAWAARDSLVRRIEIVLSGNSDQGKQSIAPGISQGRPQAMWRSRLGDRANRPVRGHPLSRGMHKRGREADQAAIPVHCGGLQQQRTVRSRQAAAPARSDLQAIDDFQASHGRGMNGHVRSPVEDHFRRDALKRSVRGSRVLFKLQMQSLNRNQRRSMGR
jgi:hypothetical protein